MSTIGLILEGEYDAVVIPVLIKQFAKQTKVVKRICRGTVTGRFRGLIEELHRLHRIDKILVVSDADGRDPDEIVRSFRAKGITGQKFAAIPIVIVEMLEAWLLADPVALKKLFGISKKIRNPEKIRDPKSELKRLLPKNLTYTPTSAARIAEALDIEVLRKRCPRFEIFRKAVVGR
jgi:hypothetical protein